MQARLIAFTGVAGAGKSTAASVLVEEGWRLVPFAAPLKAMLAMFYRHGGLTEQEIAARIGGELKDKPDPLLGGHTPRWAMQTLGTEWGREIIAGHIWVSLWAAKAAKFLCEGEAVVCDDLRFPNEADVVSQFGGLVIQLTGRALGIATSGHASERGGLAGWGLANTGTEEEFREQVRSLFGRARLARICHVCSDQHITRAAGGELTPCPACTRQLAKETA